jgi:hypothetical protein
MRFMLLMIPKGYESAHSDAMPDARAVERIAQYNNSMQKAGVLLSLDGLHPPSSGARVTFAAGRPEVMDGPFPGVEETLGGYWMIDVKSRDEAIEWAKRCPASQQEIIEVRRVQELSDFPGDVQKAATGLTDIQKHSERHRVSHQPF